MSELFLQWILTYKYIIIFPIMIIEGPIVTITTSFLIHFGYFSFWPLYLTLMAGDLAGDVIWYYIGYFGGHRFTKRFGHKFGITEETIAKVEKLFHKYPSAILLFSKITTGFGFALVTLFVAGMVKIPFYKYLFYNAIGQLFWTGGLMALGYYVSGFALKFNAWIGWLSLGAGIVVFLFLLFRLGKYMRHQTIDKL